jgi:hypothetical protein
MGVRLSIKAALLASLIALAYAPGRCVLAQSTEPTPAPQTPVQPVTPPAQPTPPVQPASPTQTNPQIPASPPAQTNPPAQVPDSAAKPGLPDAPQPAGNTQSNGKDQKDKSKCNKLPCPAPLINWYTRFENGPQVKPLTPKEKAWLAMKNVIDPFNMITILGEAGISVGADSHSAYGPGMPGYARYVGVSFTQDITGEFFNTFLIPSIMHQDPHYHRMPHRSYTRRIFHTMDAVFWAQGDNGKGMLNYGTLLGYGIDDEITNLYVPGEETNGRATARRYAIGLATAPIDNAITEFLPDVAKRIHVQVVIVQRIINQVASKDTGGT